MRKSLPARVFISCGQREGTEELQIAENIKDKLEQIGFNAYFAGKQTTLEGVKEAVLKKLINSEYFIFIDFKRERLYKETESGELEDTKEHRGSLFSHKELAIATLFDKKYLLYQERGVKERDGISKHVQAYYQKFTDRENLPNLIFEEVKQKVQVQDWDPNWRNELSLEIVESPVSHVSTGGIYNSGFADFYHMEVQNHHFDKIGRGCVGYLEKIKNCSTGKEEFLEQVELKWKGLITREASIPPQKHRELDAFYIFEDSKNTFHIGVNGHIVDYSGYRSQYEFEGPGTFELTFVVFSENFPPVRGTFRLYITSGSLSKGLIWTKKWTW